MADEVQLNAFASALLPGTLRAGTGSAPFFLSFTRHEIEVGLTDDALKRLQAISDSRDNVCNLASCAILRVSGYDYDSRELYEIPACRRFFGDLAYRWDGWLHFLEKRTSMALLFALLVQVKRPRAAGRITHMRVKSPQEPADVLTKLLSRMNELHARYDWDERARRALSDEIMDAFNRSFAASC